MPGKVVRSPMPGSEKRAKPPHPSFDWKRWDTNGYVPFAPPAIGQSVTIPAVDMVRTIL